jgi:hypothetical protein
MYIYASTTSRRREERASSSALNWARAVCSPSRSPAHIPTLPTPCTCSVVVIKDDFTDMLKNIENIDILDRYS